MTAKSESVRKPIVICFAVLDEADIIEYFIEHHLGIGVDAFVAIDLGSKDGTLEKLASYEKRGRLYLAKLGAADPLDQDDGTQWVELAQRVFDADWCLAADPDEFWMVPNHDIVRYLNSLSSSILIAPRYNVLPQRTGGGALKHFCDLAFIVRHPLEFYYDVDLAVECAGATDDSKLHTLLWGYPPEVLRRVLPKAGARTSVIRKVVPGCHDIEASDKQASRHLATDAYIAHVPFRSRDQFERKARDVSRFVERNLPNYPEAAIGLHWIRLYALLKHNLLDRDFERQMFDDVTIDEYLRSGVLVRDEALSRRLQQLRPAACPASREPRNDSSVRHTVNDAKP